MGWIEFLTQRLPSRALGAFVVALVLFCMPATLRLLASTTGSVQGRVFDPRGRVVTGAVVTLTRLPDGGLRSTQVNEVGAYEFTFVEVGPYRLEASAPGFERVSKNVIVSSGQALTADLRLPAVRGGLERIEVRGVPVALDTRSVAVQSSFTQSDIRVLPGGSESLQALLLASNTAWYSQEHLHIRGGHQVGYQVDGVEIPDLSLFGAQTPFIDPRNMKYTEVTTSGLLAEYGNRTASVVNVITPSGFDRPPPRASFEAAGGSLARGSLFGSFGSEITKKLAFYGSATGSVGRRAFNPPPDFLTPFDSNHNGRADILDRPTSQTVHNYRRALQSFVRLDHRLSSRDQISLTLGGYRTDLQIPNTVEQQQAHRDYVQFERDQFENLRWTRVLGADKLLTLAALHHFNRVEVRGHWDEPQLPLAGDNRGAAYFGGRGEIAWHQARHLLKFGAQVYGVRLRDLLSSGPIL